MRVKGFTEENFWSKVDKSGECWLWIAGKNAGGYGIMRKNGRNAVAHRVAYELAIGPIQEGMDIDHRCRDRGCVNPGHLRQVTRKQNMENLRGPSAINSSGVRGVSWDSETRKWKAQISHHSKRINLGRFSTVAEAEAVVVAKRLELFTHNDLDRNAA